MKNKSRKTVPGVLQDCKIVPITDPTEIAALERRIHAAEKSLADREVSTRPKSNSRKPVRGRLTTSELVPVTDPAEFAELERRVRAAEKAMAAREKALAALENGSLPKPRKRK